MKAAAKRPRKPTSGTVTVAVKADTAQAMKAVNDLNTAITSGGVKPGWATTEFWVALAPLVAAALAVFHVTSEPTAVRNALVLVAGLVGLGYTISRGMVKAAHAKAVGQAIRRPADPEAGTTTTGVVLFFAVVFVAFALGFGLSHFWLLLLVLALLLLLV